MRVKKIRMLGIGNRLSIHNAGQGTRRFLAACCLLGAVNAALAVPVSIPESFILRSNRDLSALGIAPIDAFLIDVEPRAAPIPTEPAKFPNRDGLII